MNRRRSLAVLISSAATSLGGLGLSSPDALATQTIDVAAGPLRVGQIWKVAPADYVDFELGQAPPAGGVRMIRKQELLRRLRQSGFEGSLVGFPAAVRVRTRSERWEPARLRAETRAAAKATLPAGVSLIKVNARSSVLVPQGTVADKLQLAKLPRRVGRASLGGTLTLVHSGRSRIRVPVTVVVDIDEQAAQPLVVKGDSLNVYIESHGARVTVQATALQDADEGELAQFRVSRTQRLVRARIESKHTARVIQK